MDGGSSDSEEDLPAGWEERATEDGSVYYVNHLIKGTQWTHPRTGRKKIVSGDLPFGWRKGVDDEGRLIFIDDENNRQTYTDPRLAFATEEKSHSEDFRQRFDSSSTAFQVLHGRDLTGKVAVITGANSGIGFETARSLSRHGCQVIFACRDIEKAKKAIEIIKDEKIKAGERCQAMKLDLASLKNVEAFAKECLKSLKKIDMLILNAALFGLSYTFTEDNYEMQFQVNHLSHLYLTLLLEPLYIAGTRIIFVSSESHRFANFYTTTDCLTADSLSPPIQQYSSMMAYNNSKLCNVLCARILAKNWLDKKICVNSLHPGNLVYTNLAREWWVYRLLWTLVRPFTKSMQQAASTTVYCATAVDLEGTTGLYFNNCYRCEMGVLAKDEDLARKVFEICVQMIKARTENFSPLSYHITVA